MDLDLATVPVAAKKVGIAPRALRRAIDEGELRGFQFGSRWTRVDLREVERWISTKQVETAAERGRRRAREA